MDSSQTKLDDASNEAKKITLPGFKKNKNVKYKKDGSPVTKIDVDTEDIIRISTESNDKQVLEKVQKEMLEIVKSCYEKIK